MPVQQDTNLSDGRKQCLRRDCAAWG